MKIQPDPDSPFDLGAGDAYIGRIGAVASRVFAAAARTRPANATAFAANKVVGDATDSYFKFTDFFRELGGTKWLTDFRVEISKAGGITMPSTIALKAILYQTQPSVLADQADYAMLTGTGRLGVITLGSPYSGGTGSTAFELAGVPDGGPLLLEAAADSKDLYARIVSSGVWTPVSAMVLNPSVRGYDN